MEYECGTCPTGLRKKQTEAFFEFKKSHPGIAMGQRTFEKCKPFTCSLLGQGIGTLVVVVPMLKPGCCSTHASIFVNVVRQH